MDSADEENAYAEVGYENLLENHLNIGGFVGFNFGTFHKNMLKFNVREYSLVNSRSFTLKIIFKRFYFTFNC